MITVLIYVCLKYSVSREIITSLSVFRDIRHVFDEGADEYKVIMLNKRYLTFRVIKVRVSVYFIHYASVTRFSPLTLIYKYWVSGMFKAGSFPFVVSSLCMTLPVNFLLVQLFRNIFQFSKSYNDKVKFTVTLAPGGSHAFSSTRAGFCSCKLLNLLNINKYWKRAVVLSRLVKGTLWELIVALAGFSSGMRCKMPFNFHKHQTNYF